MCSCSYLGSPCAAECANPARPRCGVAYVSRPRGGVAHVSTASPRDEVALFSRGVRSRAHPRLGEVPGEHALPPRGARARGGSKLTVPRALPRLRSSRREAPRRGGKCCPEAPAPPAVRRPGRALKHFSFNVWIASGEFCGGVERSPVGAPTGHLPRCTPRTSHVGLPRTTRCQRKKLAPAPYTSYDSGVVPG